MCQFFLGKTVPRSGECPPLPQTISLQLLADVSYFPPPRKPVTPESQIAFELTVADTGGPGSTLSGLGTSMHHSYR